MIGHVNDGRQALLKVHIRKNFDSVALPITVWVDTAFNGYFVFSRTLIESLKLEQLATAEAILADGSKVSLEAFICYVDWFGHLKAAQVIANDGKLPLLGTELLAGRILTVDYARGSLSLE